MESVDLAAPWEDVETQLLEIIQDKEAESF